MEIYAKTSLMWILLLLLVGNVHCEEQASNLTSVAVDQLLNISCINDSNCKHIHYAARCKVASFDYDVNGSVTFKKECSCTPEEGFYKIENENSCIFHSQVSDNCDLAGKTSFCFDHNSECKYGGDNSGQTRCHCKRGSLLVKHNSTWRCAYQISPRIDPHCDLCEFNNGICYDLDNNNHRDGCHCPASFSGDNCQNVHVNVKCNSTEMTICYKPHPQVNASDSVRIYAAQKHNVLSCRGRFMPDVCGEGQYLLRLPLHEALLDVCDTQKYKTADTIKYMNTITVQVHSQYTSKDDIVFNTFCSFTHMSDISSIGLSVNSYSDSEIGQSIKPFLSLSIKNQMGEFLRHDIYHRTGDFVYLNFFLNTENGYSSLRVEECTLSSSAAMPDFNAETQSIITQGCPTPGQTFITEENMFRKVQNQSNELQTGLVQLVQLKESTNLHIHCKVKLCIKHYSQGCVPINCNADTSRKRRAIEQDGDTAMVDMHREISLQDNTQNTVILGMSLTAITLCIIVLAFVILLISVMVVQGKGNVRKKKKKRLKLISTRQYFMKNLDKESTPSHMTESKV